MERKRKFITQELFALQRTALYFRGWKQCFLNKIFFSRLKSQNLTRQSRKANVRIYKVIMRFSLDPVGRGSQKQLCGVGHFILVGLAQSSRQMITRSLCNLPNLVLMIDEKRPTKIHWFSEFQGGATEIYQNRVIIRESLSHW